MGFLALGLATAAAPKATASPITLGTATNYGVLTGVGETFSVNGKFKLTGNLGLATGYNVVISGANSQSGTTYYDGSGSGGQWSDSGTYTTAGSVNQSMTSTITAAENGASSAAALSATSGFATAYQNTALSVSGTSITLNAVTNLSENVLDITSLSLLNGTITLNDNGYTGAKFIINVTGGFSINSTGSLSSIIKGINGATASDVIFNIEGTGSTVSITGNSSNSIIGTILAPQRNVTIGGGGTLSGEIIAGANNLGQSYTLTSQSTGFNINSFGYVPLAKVPEPSSLALFSTGLIAVGYWGFRRRRQGLTSLR